MDVTNNLLPDPLSHPLFPSIDSLIEYAKELDYESNAITFEWATHEIRNHSLGYIRVGLVADVVRRYKIYQHPQDSSKQCRCFREYCEKILGKTEWYVNKIIDAAKAALALINSGCPLEKLPTCEYQARPLAKIFKEATKTWNNFWNVEQANMPDDDAISPVEPSQIVAEKWQQVIDQLPPHQISGEKVAEILEDKSKPLAKRKVYMRTSTREKLERAAREAGMTPDDYLDALLDSNLDNNLDADAVEEPTAEQIETWSDDVKELVEQHERSSTGTITKNSPHDGERIIGDVCDNRDSCSTSRQKHPKRT